MKRLVSLIVCIFVLSGQAFAMTYTNEPKDYEGMPWGSSVSDFARNGRQLVFVEQSAEPNISIYRQEKQNLVIFNKNFDEITYHFYQGRFYMVRAVKSNDTEMSQSLYQTIASIHGKHSQQNDNLARKTTTYWWQGDTTYILLNMNHMRSRTVLTFFNQPLYQELAMGRKQQAKQTSKIKERG